MKLICGLGNPERQHERNRHNIGFRVAEEVARRAGAARPQEKFDALTAQGALGPERILVVRPLTYMNLSGRSVSAAVRFYKIDLDSVLIIHDELDLPFGRLQLKRGGGVAGHNGLESIASDLGSTEFTRLRFGIGKPHGPDAQNRIVGHVLSDFNGDEVKEIDRLIGSAGDAAESWTREGLETAMNRFNIRPKQTTEPKDT